MIHELVLFNGYRCLLVPNKHIQTFKSNDVENVLEVKTALGSTDADLMTTTWCLIQRFKQCLIQVKWCVNALDVKTAQTQTSWPPPDAYKIKTSKFRLSNVLEAKTESDADLMTATWCLAEQLRKCWPRTHPLFTHPIFTTPFYTRLWSRSSNVDQSILVLNHGPNS